MYAWSSSGGDTVAKGLKMIEEWAKEKGAEDLTITTHIPRLFAQYGFKQHVAVVMTKDLEE